MSLDVPAVLTAQLDELAAAHGVALRVLLFALHAATIAAVAGSSEVTVGLGVNGRPPHPDGDRVVGVFNNIVPVPVRLGRRSWRELIATVAELDARLTPFARLPTAQLHRLDQRRNRYFSLFKFTRFRPYAELADMPGLQLLGGLAPDQTHVPVTVFANIDPITSGLQILLDYDAAVVPAGAAQQLAQRQLQVLAEFVADPGAGPAELSFAASAGPAEPAAEFEALPARLLRALRDNPDSVVVADDTGQLTARALLQRAAVVAGRLREVGAGPGTVIALQLPRTRALVIGWTAALLCGACVLPLDAAESPVRTAELLTAARAGVLLSVGVDASVPAGCVPLDISTCAGAPIARAAVVDPEHPAWIIFTSGSTGRPKGVVVPYRAAGRYLDTAAASYGTGRTLAHTSPAVDFTITTVLLPLLVGGCVRLLADSTVQALAATLRTESVDVLKLTPTHLSALTALGLPVLPQRLLLLGGEALQRGQLTDRWQALSRSIRNEYGPTEATVGCLLHEFDEREQDSSVAIGRPLPGVGVRVVRADPPAAAGDWTSGELWIGGDQVATGYLGDPAATAQSFVPDTDRPGQRCYRSGDLVLTAAAGVQHYLGRLDRQLKIRGHRVEPAEVEAALLTLDGILAAAVGPSRREGRTTLVAWVVSRSALWSGAALRRTLSTSLPSQLVPTAVYLVNSIPLTGAGKTDFAALAAAVPDPAVADETRLLDRLEQLSDDEVERLLDDLKSRPEQGSVRR